MVLIISYKTKELDLTKEKKKTLIRDLRRNLSKCTTINAH